MGIRRKVKEARKHNFRNQSSVSREESVREKGGATKQSISARSLRRARKFKRTSRWIAGIAAALSIPAALLVFWQYYVDVPHLISDVRFLEAVEKIEQLPGGGFGKPMSVVMTLTVFVANTGVTLPNLGPVISRDFRVLG